jgi:Flp pilus assembly protein TadD
VLFAAAAFSPVLDNGFVNYDDDLYVTANSHVQAGLTGKSLWWALTTTDYFPSWNPLTWASLQLDHQLNGLDARGYHLTNLLLHLVSTLLLFVSLRRMTGDLGPSAAVAAFFAVHPLCAEPVAWVSARKDVLSTFFWMLTLLAYADYARAPSLARYLPLVLSFALGLLAKPMLVTLPVVLLLLDYWPLRRIPGAGPPLRVTLRLVAEKLPLLVLAAASSAMTLYAQRRSLEPLGHLSLATRAGVALVSYVSYLGKLFFPVDLIPFYAHPRDSLPAWQVSGAALLLTGLTAGLLWAGRKRPYLAVGWLWYLGTLVPVIGLLPVGWHATADRYTYVPMIGVLVLVAWSANELPLRRPRVRVLAGAGVLVLLLAAWTLTWIQVRYWHDSVALWEHAQRVDPGSDVIQVNLGGALAAEGDIDRALGHFAEAVRLRPDNFRARQNLGQALMKRGRPAEAVEQFSAALRLEPDSPLVLNNMGRALMVLDKPGEAAGYFRAALRSEPDNASLHANLGNASIRAGGVRQALASYRRAAALRPDVAGYRCGLALALHEDGQARQARAEYAEALRLDPAWPEKNRRAAWSLATHSDARRRDGGQALLMARQVCLAARAPRAEQLDVLAAALAEVGRYEEAAAEARKAAALLNAAHRPELALQVRRRAELYERKLPFRE